MVGQGGVGKGGKEEWEKIYSLPLQSITYSGIVTFLVHLTNGARKKGHLHGKKKKPTSYHIQKTNLFGSRNYVSSIKLKNS